jgi:hypothetical protein
LLARHAQEPVVSGQSSVVRFLIRHPITNQNN